MNKEDIPEPYKTKLSDVRPRLGKELTDVIDMSIETCPDWESVKDCIQNCTEFLIEDSKLVQNIVKE